MYPPSTLLTDQLHAARCRDGVQYPCAWKRHTQQIFHHITSTLVFVLYVPSLYPDCFSRTFLFFSSIHIRRHSSDIYLGMSMIQMVASIYCVLSCVGKTSETVANWNN